jgi:hypothetical protein
MTLLSVPSSLFILFVYTEGNVGFQSHVNYAEVPFTTIHYTSLSLTREVLCRLRSTR